MGYSKVSSDSKAYPNQIEDDVVPLLIGKGARNRIFPWTVEGLVYVVLFLLALDVFAISPLDRPTSAVEAAVLPAFGGESHLPARLTALALIIAPLLLILVIATQWTIAACLHYTGWLYEEHGKKPSLATKAYMMMVAVLNKIPSTTMSFQNIVPTMPIPAVKDTVKGYLRSMRPLLKEGEYAELVEMAAEFERDLAPELQRKLWLKWLTAKNYVSDWWKEVVYMRYRSSLLRTNIGCTDIIYRPTTSIQAARAAHITLLRQHFNRDLVDEQNGKPVSMGGIPMCSNQYVDFHRSIRIPHETSDKFVRLPQCDHIIVYHAGCWYRVQIVFGGKMINSAELERTLQDILDRAAAHKPVDGERYLGALTAGPRDLWAKVRRKMLSGINGESLAAIENSLDIMFLDEEERGFDAADPEAFKREFARSLTGDGYALWCDKPSTYFFSKNGRFTSNAEHSVCDAMVHCHVREHSKYHEAFSPSYDSEGHCVGEINIVPPAERLKWDFDEETQSSIAEAYRLSKEVADDFDNTYLLFEEYGKDLIKKAKVSPDAFIQQCLQMAYYRDQGKFELTYEPAVMRLWQHGRTETIRSCSEESCAFVRSMQNEAETPKSRLALLRTACERHQELTRDAMAGKGVDRHLFALFVLTKYLQKSSPFLEKAFSMNYALSTSQTPQHQTREFSSALNKERDLFWPAGGFTCPDGSNYGVCYTIGTTGDLLNFNITTWKSIENSNADRFRGHILDSLRDMRTMLEEALKA